MSESKKPFSAKQLQELVAVVRTQSELDMCPITYVDDTSSQMLDYPRLLIIRPVYRVQIRVTSPPANPTNAEQFKTERSGMLVDCSLTVVSGVGVAGAAIAAGPSLGASVPVAVLLWAGFLTSAASCANSARRSWETVKKPDSDSLYQWDNAPEFQTYRTIRTANTVVGIGAGIASLPSAGKDVYKLYKLNKLNNPALKSTQTVGERQLLRRFTQVRSQDVVSREFRSAAIKAGHNLANSRFSDSQKRKILDSILRQVKGRIFAETTNTLTGLAGNVKDGVGLEKDVHGKNTADAVPQLLITIEIIENDYEN